MPTKIILLEDKNLSANEQTINNEIISKNSNQKFFVKSIDLNFEFDEKEHVLKTIEENNIPYVSVNTQDVNSKKVIDEVIQINDHYIIYSGPGGSILRKEILSKKKFIHVHPGLLPQFRGSTTIYYSILSKSKIGCSVLILDEEIDKGPVLYNREYDILEQNIDFDYVLDPLLRAKTLIKFLKSNEIKPIKQIDDGHQTTFYIIHPLLKHISILKHNTIN